MYGVPIPPSVSWLQSASPDEVSYDLFRAVCADYSAYQLQCGVDPERIMPVDQFVQPGDLQTLANVVSWWPQGAPHKPPTLSALMTAIVSVDDGPKTTFVDMLEISKARLGPWMAARKVNPHDPNESPEDKAKRLNRERVARWRIKHAEEPIDDPDLAALVRNAKLQADYVTQGRRWLKDVERRAKATYDAAVVSAKQARLDTVSKAEAELAAQIQRAEDAKALVDSYKGRK